MRGKPFDVLPPRQFTRADGGWMLLGGVVYIDENGKPAQAAALFPDDADAEEIERRKVLFAEIEQKHGVNVKI